MPIDRKLELDIVELLQSRGLPHDSKVMIVRHQDSRIEFSQIVREQKYFETYQRLQHRNIFDGYKYIVSFVGYTGTLARFIGVYQVNGREEKGELKELPNDFPRQLLTRPISDYFYYHLEKMPGYEALEDRIVIDWGKSTRAWFQKLSSREVVEVLPRGYVMDFPGYLDFILPFNDLVRIIKAPNSNRIWHTMLSAVAGVYLIVDKQTGKQYIGSAYGEKGILGRWTTYSKNKHGGNKELIKLLEKDPDYAAKNFSFTLLHTLPKTLTNKEVIAFESKFKDKLGSKAFSLNCPEPEPTEEKSK